jgi:HSP20 family molecular chaperone IbpA
LRKLKPKTTNNYTQTITSTNKQTTNMALIPHTFFPRSMFDVDLWHRPFDYGPRALDLFDPFDDLDMQLNSMVNWLDRPTGLLPQQPRVPQKYRVTVDCAGYNPKSIKTDIQGDKLIVSGEEGNKANGGNDEDYSHRSFKRTFQLPKLVEKEKMTSFMTKNGELVIDIPYKMDESGQTAEGMWPRIVDTDDGHKQVNLDLQLPNNIDPSKVQVTAKDRDIIVKAEDKTESPNGYSKFYFYRRSTMPESTDMNGLKCTFDNNKLSITAPFMGNNALKDNEKKIAIEHKGKK